MKTRLMKRYLDLLDKYEAADQIAQQLAKVTAERDKLRENGTDLKLQAAVKSLEGLGYCWLHGMGWTQPRAQQPAPAAPAEKPPLPTSPEVPCAPLIWPKQATHYLHNPKAMGAQYYFAEFHDGVYYHLPVGKTVTRDWEWERRGSMTVGAGAWQVVEVRK